VEKPSLVNISQILTVDKSELAESAGKLSATAIAAVCEGLRMLLDRL
jgi:mRNA-degrading endonuclease toxin of MazEF toxin-antitoxin module